MNKEIKYWYLHNHHVFSKLKPEELKELEVQVGFIKAKKGQIVQLIEGSIKRIYFLKQGLLKAAKIEGDVERTLDIIHKDDIFGEIPGCKICEASPQFVQVVSSEAIICTFTLENFEKILLKNPAIALEFSKAIGNKMVRLQRKYNDLVFKDAKSRLKELLKELAHEYGIVDSDLAIININFTNQEIADLIGCRRQTINVLMNELKAEGKLEFTRNSLRIPNISSLNF